MTAKDVPPGGVGEIKATFESKGYQGKVTKTINVETNDPTNPTVRLSLQGTIVADVTVDPQAINFGFIKKGEPASPVILTIRLREGKGLKIESVTSDSDLVRIKQQRETEQEVVYEVGLKEKLPIGRIYGQLLVATNNEKSPKLFVPFRGTIQGNVKVTPQIVSFGMVEPGTRATRTLRLDKEGDKPFTVKQVTVTGGKIAYQVAKAEEGSSYELELTYDPGDQKEGRIAEKIFIIVNDPDESTLEVPVYGTIASKPVSRKQ